MYFTLLVRTGVWWRFVSNKLPESIFALELDAALFAFTKKLLHFRLLLALLLNSTWPCPIVIMLLYLLLIKFSLVIARHPSR